MRRLSISLPAIRVPFSRRLPIGRVAVVRLHGPITGGARAADWIETVRRTRENRRVPAVVLDIDSGGGSATASADLSHAIERLAEVKPVVAAIRGVGASGAYLVATGAHRIVANPASIVGSIGVLAVGPRLPRLLDRLGVGVTEHRAGRLKGIGAPWRDETEEEAATEQSLVDAIYDHFVERVARSRKLPEATVRELATGEVWLGSRARELGLVDEIGDLERAVEIAADMAGVAPRFAPVRLPRPLLGRLVGRFATGAGRAFGSALATRARSDLEGGLEDRFRL